MRSEPWTWPTHALTNIEAYPKVIAWMSVMGGVNGHDQARAGFSELKGFVDAALKNSNWAPAKLRQCGPQIAATPVAVHGGWRVGGNPP